jgi:hypothetical protein
MTWTEAPGIYASINGESGGQETKLTKNESAALETVATMGWEQFTIKTLQEALGLSYHQTYRILHGYVSRGTTYSGLLEKCPAISFFDTMVTEDVDGYAVRRREHLFSFDRTAYRRWAFGAGVWIDGGGDRDDGPDDPCSVPAGLPRDSGTGREDRKAGKNVCTDSTSTERETRLSLSTKVQQNTHTHTGTCAGVHGCGCVCDPRNAGSDPDIPDICAGNADREHKNCPLSDGTLRNTLKRDGKGGAGVQESLPGVLKHTEFTRVSTDLGRCSVCDEGKAVFISGDRRSVLCEKCYGRLVQAWNEKRGVGR